jgi:succinate dehydrogenase, hydrophobic membrane anchor protein
LVGAAGDGAAADPLVVWFAASLLAHLGSDYAGVIAWLHEPVTYGLMVLLLGRCSGMPALGLQVVLEDYVQGEAAKLATILLAKGACLGLFMAGFVALSKIAFAG